MAIDRNTPKQPIKDPPVVGTPLSCGAQRDNSMTNAINKNFAATEAASINNAKIIRQYNDDDKITTAKCANIPFMDPVPCVDRNLNITGYGNTTSSCPGGSLPATKEDLKQLVGICMNALLKDREIRNSLNTARYAAELAKLDRDLVDELAAAQDAFTACCRANKNSEGCNPKTPTTV